MKVQTLENTFAREGVHHLCVPVDDLDATLAEAAMRDVPPVDEPFVAEEIGRTAVVRNNNGNLVEFPVPR